MADEPVFRLISVRQPARRNPQFEPPGGRISISVDLDAFPGSDLQVQIKNTAKTAPADARRTAQQAKENGVIVTTLEGLDPSVMAALQWVDAHRTVPFKDLNFGDDFRTAVGKTLADLVASEPFKTAQRRLADSLVVEATLGETGPVSTLAVEALKVLKMLEAEAAGKLNANDNAHLADFLSASTVVIPSPSRGDIGTVVNPPPIRRPPPKGEQVDEEALRRRFNELKTARDDLAKQLRGKQSLTVIPKETVSPGATSGERTSARIAELNRTNALLSAALKEHSPELSKLLETQTAFETQEGDPIGSVTSTVVISPTTINNLKPENAKTLTSIQGWGAELGPIRGMARIDRELQTISETITLPEVQSAYVRFFGGYIDKGLLYDAAGVLKFDPPPATAVADCRYAVGVADLLLVKQTLKAYELADFAHVENALRGESREREHRRLQLQEETTAEETERESERERNLQSTERNEMQTEATRQLRTDLGVQAGLTVSGSYGPTVSFSASLNASFATSVQESQRKATSFSREVTEKTSERIRERVRQERRRRVLEQIEELNRHKIDNTGNVPGHLRGIYRWLNKIYDAQVLNYGKRMMYEFVIPEPAAYLIYTLVEHPPVDSTLPPKPEPPTFGTTPLKPENLTRYNYQRYVAQYSITNAPTPPSEFKVTSHFDKLDGQESPATFGRAGKLAIPDDYEATGAYLNRYYVFPEGQSHRLKLVIGGIGEDLGTLWGSRYIDFDQPFRGEVSIAYGGFGLRAMALGVDVFCMLTEEGFAKWQQKAYDSIIEGYERLRSDYEEKLAASQIQQGVRIIGRNPLENRRMEQDELKKLIIMILRGSPYLDLNSFLSSSEPAMDIAKVCENGKLIRFLENAFEWHNMSYICYSYFWGRHSRWADKLLRVAAVTV